MKKAVVFIVIALVVVTGAGILSMRGFAGAKATEKPAEGTVGTVERGALKVTVVETGTVDAREAVEVKSRVTGRLAKLFVDEGDTVRKGQLIAIIDPQETRLRVEQDQAQLRGAQSSVDRASLEIEQRRVTAEAAYRQALARLAQLEMEARAQPALTNAAIRQAETSLESARQERERLTRSIHPTQRTNAQAAVDEAKANFDNADLELKRQSELAGKGFVAGRSLDTAKLTYNLAKVRLDTARDNLSKLEAQLRAEIAKQDEAIAQAQAELVRAQTNRMLIGTKRQEVASARAEVSRAKAALNEPAILAKQRDQGMATVAQLRSVLSDSERQLGETEIRAPYDGVVTVKGLNVGELATGLSTFSSGSTIVKIEDRSRMRVKLDMNEIDVARLSLGMTAKVEVDALPNAKFTGHVRKIAPASKAASQTGQATAAASADAVVRYQVEIVLDSTDAKLRSGMTAKCSMDVQKKDSTLLVATEFVGKEKDKAFVMLAPDPKDKTAKPKRQDVFIGSASGSKTEILSGVEEGTKLVRPPFNGPERKGAMQFGGDE